MVLAVVLVLGLVTVWLSSTAGRLDRLHIRLATAQASLDRQLVDRAAATADVAHSGVLDPAGAVLLLGAADAARQAAGDLARPDGQRRREAAESVLSVDLRAVLGSHDAVAAAWAVSAGRPLLLELAAACDRVRLARRFHDDLVTRTQAVRRRPVVRWVRLAGHAAWPAEADLDDAAPEALLALADGGPQDVAR